MNLEGQLMTQAPPVKPNPGLFKRNPPIAGEAEAIEAAKNGDAEAFSKLYTLHKRRVYTLCLRMLGNVSEAEDMTQEAFLHLFRKLGSFRGESAFSTWLHRLTVNLVLMHLRKKRPSIRRKKMRPSVTSAAATQCSPVQSIASPSSAQSPRYPPATAWSLCCMT
jgi:DNA-directed RNA polymerase specialized sigma24 family protein